jgi:glucokinase
VTLAIGVDIGGTKIAAARVNEDGEVTGLITRPTPKSGEELLEATRESVGALLADEVAALGFGVAGLVDHASGVFVYGPHLDGREIPFGATLQKQFGLPVSVDNDANVSGFAEACLGAGAGRHEVLMVTLGTGIGGALIIGGRVERGRAFAGEFGHMSVAADGPYCACGRRGCWETLASGRRLDELARDAVARNPDGEIARAAGNAEPTGYHVGTAARQGDPEALSYVRDVGRWLGIGFANLIAALDPDVIVVGGGVSRLGDLMLEIARETAAAHTFARSVREPTPIMVAAFGHLAGVVGAGLMALEEAP